MKKMDGMTVKYSFELPADEGVVFIAYSEGAPFAVLGRRGNDGHLYVGQTFCGPDGKPLGPDILDAPGVEKVTGAEADALIAAIMAEQRARSVVPEKPIMPGFVFARRHDVEIEADFMLAGDLIIDLPKRTEPKKRHKRLLSSIVKQLAEMAATGQMPTDAMIYGWPPDGRPAYADAITGNMS